uniref:Uncharacterized protein n=1 Tax=Macrostomum lignano TaxID=282301 RepID=A0A1I8FHM5_9PLAT
MVWAASSPATWTPATAARISPRPARTACWCATPGLGSNGRQSGRHGRTATLLGRVSTRATAPSPTCPNCSIATKLRFRQCYSRIRPRLFPELPPTHSASYLLLGFGGVLYSSDLSSAPLNRTAEPLLIGSSSIRKSSTTAAQASPWPPRPGWWAVHWRYGRLRSLSKARPACRTWPDFGRHPSVKASSTTMLKPAGGGGLAPSPGWNC